MNRFILSLPLLFSVGSSLCGVTNFNTQYFKFQSGSYVPLPDKISVMNQNDLLEAFKDTTNLPDHRLTVLIQIFSKTQSSISIANIKDADGKTLLHSAMTYKATCYDKDSHLQDLIKTLIQNGCNPLAQDNEGNTAIHDFVSSSNESNIVLLNTLLKECAKKKETLLNIKNNAGKTALQLAVIREYPPEEVITSLTNAGADVMVRDQDGAIPLHNAIVKNCNKYKEASTSVALIKLLLQKKGNEQLRAVNGKGENCLHIAAEEVPRHVPIEILDCLLAHEKNQALINSKTPAGKTPLHVAATGSSGLEKIRLLIKNGANTEATDTFGTTPLNYFLCLNADINTDAYSDYILALCPNTTKEEQNAKVNMFKEEQGYFKKLITNNPKLEELVTNFRIHKQMPLVEDKDVITLSVTPLFKELAQPFEGLAKEFQDFIQESEYWTKEETFKQLINRLENAIITKQTTDAQEHLKQHPYLINWFNYSRYLKKDLIPGIEDIIKREAKSLESDKLDRGQQDKNDLHTFSSESPKGSFMTSDALAPAILLTTIAAGLYYLYKKHRFNKVKQKDSNLLKQDFDADLSSEDTDTPAPEKSMLESPAL